MTQTSPLSHHFQHPIATALGLSFLIMSAEYVTRRIAVPALPAISSTFVNDMLLTALCYITLVLVTAPDGKRHLRVLAGALGSIFKQAGTWLPWLGFLAILFLTFILPRVDQTLWGAVRLPAVTIPFSSTIAFPSLSPVLIPISLIAVNGLFIPFAEERLWRGLVQPRFCQAWGSAVGVLLTAFLFSVKHALVDASLARLLFETGSGVILGIVALRGGWRASAVTHALVNTFSSLVILFYHP